MGVSNAYFREVTRRRTLYGGRAGKTQGKTNEKSYMGVEHFFPDGFP